MHPTRREMIRLGLGSSAVLACGTAVPTFLARTAAALDGARPDKGRILVVVQLDGGNDGLNTVVPHRDDAYRRHRPTLQVPSREVRRVDDRVGLHPALEGFSRLLDDGRLAIVQGVGYPNPSRSHFESMATWQTARLDPDAATPGWLVRTLDRRGVPEGDVPALHVHDRFPLPRALAAGSQTIPTLDRPEQFRRRVGAPDSSEARSHREALDRLARRRSGEAGSLLDFVERTGVITYASAARLEAVQKEAPSASGYPQYYGLARRLRLIAQLIKAELATTIYYTHLDGFDTHANQASRHPDLLRELGGSVKAFLDDLARAGEADRVLVLAFSEFGRRLAENASGGTDHGTAAPVFLAGKAVRPGLCGSHPDLDDLEDGDPKHIADFRQVYATLLNGWLGVASRGILGGAFDPLTLLRVDG